MPTQLRPKSLSLLILLALFGCGHDAAPVAPLAGKPVVLIVFDALAARHVHHLGYETETTPNLDRLAKEGVTFAKAFSPAPYTLASIPSLFTGRLPDRHGVYDGDHALPAVELTLAELLAANGYQTFGAVANIQGGSLRNLQQGFEVYEELYRTEEPNAKGHGVSFVQPGDFVQVLQRWDEMRDRQRTPFFYAHVLQPHMPYSPPSRFFEDLVDSKYNGPNAKGMDPDWVIDFARSGGKMVIGDGPDEVSLPHANHILSLYDGHIRYADDALGRMLDELKRAGIFDDALIVVTSDHGEAMWEHGVLGHSRTIFDEMVHVPLVVKLPAGMEGTANVVSDLTSIMDLFPSICAWLDVPAPETIDGKLLPQLLDPEPDPMRKLLLRTFHPDPVIATRGVNSKLRFDPRAHNGAGEAKFYNLRKDPQEKLPIPVVDGTVRAGQVNRMRKQFEALRASAAPQAEGALRSEQDEKMIEGLGYSE